MDDMEQHEDRSPGIGEMPVILPTEASLRLQVTDLLLGRPRGARTGWLTLEQGDVLQQIEAALEAYGSYYYSPERR
jgi:hypothetical protein